MSVCIAVYRLPIFLLDVSAIRCLFLSTTSPILFHIDSTEESCPRVRPIGNGKLQPGDMVTEAETITLVCDPGYAIAGNAKTVCGANSAYSAPLGKCRSE